MVPRGSSAHAFYAHTDPKWPNDASKWEPLFTPECAALKGDSCVLCESLNREHGHLNKVAWWTAKFAEEMFPAGSPKSAAARKWGYLAGLWHDLGKFHPFFQRKLAGERLQIEHAGAGAAFARAGKIPSWQVIAFVIAGHHCGLANLLCKVEMGDVLTALQERLSRAESSLRECQAFAGAAMQSLLELPTRHLSLPFFPSPDSIAASDFIRLLYSALVDADSLATEAFCSPANRSTQYWYNPAFDRVETLWKRFDLHLDTFARKASPSLINSERARILAWCREAASQPSGFFQLNVPTGGGKTLSAMAFGLRHAATHAARGMRRVVIAVPYTSIIEQNAAIYCEILGTANVIEHHSNLDNFAEDEDGGDELTVRRRLACENWDAPIVVTTNVQLFESLFGHKRRRARKLHNLAGSVIILDEAQCVPADYLQLILSALRDLVENYGCTVVICTATQPAWKHRAKLPFGITAEQLRSIIPPTVELARLSAFDRVRIKWPHSADPTTQEELSARLLDEPCVMAIVHRKKDARELARRLSAERPGDPVFHLSTNMCPVHRREVLARIRAALSTYREDGVPCRVVSTQLVEAGVDLDFPVIYRALAGLDSIAQAAGRCNREGRSEKGRVVVFLAETDPPDGHLKHCAEITQKMLDEYGGELDLRDSRIFEEFFVRLYRDRNLDAKHLVRHAQALNFETLGREFRLIEDGDQSPVVILFDEEARERLSDVVRIEEHAGEPAAGRHALRALQPYTVLVRPAGMKTLRGALQPLFEGSAVCFLDPELYAASYDPIFGLATDDEPTIPPAKLIVA